jgi:uncharacterized protein (TIGR02246 family)
MSTRPVKRVGAFVAKIAVAVLIAVSNGSMGNQAARSAESALPESPPQEQKAPSSPAKSAPAAAVAAPESQGEKEIRAFDELYVRDFNSANTKALAARFTEDAEVIEDDGLRYQGRTLIEERLAETFAAAPGARMAIEIDAIRFLSPDAAKEEGRTIVTPAQGGPATHRRYTALLIKTGGSWLLSSVREEHDPMVSPHDRLEVLAWMLGDWIDEGPDAVVRVNCHWSDDRNFLIRTFTVKREGKDVMTVTQRIGWDPAAKQIRSWEFDSEGGFGEGKWGGDGDRWVIRHTATRPDGATVTATNTMVRERPDLVRWNSTDRFLGHEPIPDEPDFAFARVPAPPAAHPSAPATPAAPTQRERSPR